MKIKHVTVKNFRSLKEVDVDIDNYSVFVGTNGSGKSSVLYALEWFFNGYALEVGDVHGRTDRNENVPQTPVEENSSEQMTVSVTVTFSDLTPKDRERLVEYGRGEFATFSRTWTLGDGKSKVFGNSLAGRGFAPIRAMTRVGDFRPAYSALRATIEDLPELPTNASKENVSQALADWESLGNHRGQLELIESSDASHMFGINGPNVIRECIRLVLIPAATDIANKVAGAGKSSALSELLGSLLVDASASARDIWMLENREKIEELNLLVKLNIGEASKMQTDRINSRLGALVPNTLLQLIPTVPDWSPKGEASMAASISVNGIPHDIGKQGHGIQRAVMIAMFQSLVPDSANAIANHVVGDGESDELADARLIEELAELPVLVVAIEEPEIYQHPVRARAFARVLAELAGQTNAQVILATHSPYFVRPQQFNSLRRFRLKNGETSVIGSSIESVARSARCTEDQAEKIIMKRLPNTFAEGFFADAVVLVEGDTDKVVIEAIAERLGMPLDAFGVCVLEMTGKEGLAIPNAMLLSLDIPTYILVDGDALGANRKYTTDIAKRNDSHASHKRSTENICAWLPSEAATASFANLPYVFEDPTVVTDKFTIWQDDIEEELAKWPSYMTKLTSDGYLLRDKDLLGYRASIFEAEIDELPGGIKACIRAINGFHATST